MLDQTLVLALPHRAGQAARHDENGQLEQGEDQTAPPNNVRVGGPEVDELLLASRSLRVDRLLTGLSAIRVAAAGGWHSVSILQVILVTAALELN